MEVEALGPASVRNNEWTGTVAFVSADDSSIQEIARERLGDRADDYFLVAFEFFIGGSRVIAGHPLFTSLTLYLLPKNGWDTVPDAIEQTDGVLDVLRLSVDPTPKVEEFFQQVSKRFQMRLELKTIDRSGAKLRISGDLTELEGLEPSDFDESL